jgi:hypothetical protein
MNYKKITQEAIDDTEIYKTADLTDLALVESLLQRFKAHKLLLCEMYAEVARLYDEKRDLMDKEFVEKYREHRKTMSQRDSEIEAKFNTIKHRKEKRNLKCSRDKSLAMLKAIDDVIISLATSRKYNLNEERYG